MSHRRARAALLLAALVSTFTLDTAGQGLLGGAFQWAGRALGVKPVEDLGRNLDAEHRRFKESNPAYANLEQTASELVRTPFGLACAATFDSVIGSVRGACNRMASQLTSEREQLSLAVARDRLQKLGVVTSAELSGVSIRWCQGDFLGSGIVPAPNEIILNRRLLDRPSDDIAATIAHELHHVRQFRSMGAVPFKCNYVQHYIACSGCQNMSHPMEAEAYRYEASISTKLIATADGSIRFDPSSRVMSVSTALGGITGTPTQSGSVPDAWPPTQNISERQYAVKACTGSGLLPTPVEGCLDQLAQVMKSVQAMISEDKTSGTSLKLMSYVRRNQKEIESVCERIASDPRISKPAPAVRYEYCEFNVRGMIDERIERGQK